MNSGKGQNYEYPQDGSLFDVEMAVKPQNEEIHEGDEEIQHDVEKKEDGV